MINEHPKFDDDAPQFSGKINDIFVDWVTDVKLRGGKTQGRNETSLERHASSGEELWTVEADHPDDACSGRPRKLYREQHCHNAHEQWLHKSWSSRMSEDAFPSESSHRRRAQGQVEGFWKRQEQAEGTLAILNPC